MHAVEAGEADRGRDRAVGEIGAGVACVEFAHGRVGGRGSREFQHLVLGFERDEVGGVGLAGAPGLAAAPARVAQRRLARALDHRLVRGEDGEEIADADEFDRFAGRAADGRLVERLEMGEAARAAEHARVDHARKCEVVDEAGAEDFVGQIDAGKAAADHLEIGGLGERGGAARFASEIDGLGERPVIERGRRAVLGGICRRRGRSRRARS